MTAAAILSPVASKTCTKCKNEKFLFDFHTRSDRGVLKPSSRCKECLRADDRDRAKANPEKVKDQNAKQYAKNAEKCRAYAAKYRADHPEQIKAALAKWYSENVARQAEYKSRYYSENPDKLLERKEKLKAYFADNANEIKERAGAYRAANLEQIKERSRAMYAKNAEKMRLNRKAYVLANHKKVKASMAATRIKYLEVYKARSKKWMAENKEKCTTYKLNRRARKLYNGGSISSNLVARLMATQKGKCACCGKSLDDGYHMDHIMPLALGGANDDSNMQLLTPTCNLQKSKKHPVDFMQERGFLL